MDLFTRADKQKEILGADAAIIHLKSNGKFDVTIHGNFLKVEPRGFANAINKGLTGEKTYDLNNVSGVQYKKPGMTTGYLQIILIGGRDAHGGVLGAVKDENSITFSKKEDHLILQIKEYIENYIHSRSVSSTPAASGLDEIRKLKELLDIGAITQEEFEAKKSQLLKL